MDAQDEEALRGVVRREAAQRVEAMARAVRESPRWDEVFRQAHSLAGIARELDAELAQEARALAGRLQDEYGRPARLTPTDEEEAREHVARLQERFRQLPQA